MRNGVARLLNGEALEDVSPAQKEPGGRIGENHFAGAKALAFGDAGFVEIHQTGFGAGDEKAIMGQGIAQGAQAIAIELGADELSIGKDQSGRAIPGLALLGERGQCTADVARKQRIFFKGRRNHGEHGFLGGQTFEKPELEAVVEAGGIADVFLEKGEPRAYGQP